LLSRIILYLSFVYIERSVVSLYFMYAQMYVINHHRPAAPVTYTHIGTCIHKKYFTL